MRAITHFIASLSNLVEAHTVELRREGQRFIGYVLVQIAVLVLLLTGVGLVLTGMFHLLVTHMGAAGACLVVGAASLLLGIGVFTWHATQQPMDRAARRTWSERDDSY